NWELIKEFSADIKEGMYVSCLIDVELSGGKITLSLGGYGDAGYYQVNKVIDASGCHNLTFHISNILPGHRDALFARVYFYPDGISKEVKLKRFSAIPGYYPDVRLEFQPCLVCRIIEAFACLVGLMSLRTLNLPCV